MEPMTTLNSILMILLAVSLGLAVYFLIKWQSAKKETKILSKRFEEDINAKSREMNNVVDNLRAAQFKLLETGKISAVSSLSAGILHQISQPITAIHGFARFLKKEMKPDDVFYKPIYLMEEQSIHLTQMLNDLMGLIRHREIKKEFVDVNSVIRRSMDLLVDELRIRKVKGQVSLQEGLPQIFADQIYLQQIFLNIVTNALEALNQLPRSEDRLLTIGSALDVHKNEVRVFFRDSGPGILPEDQSRVFEPFFSTKTRGAGIGLALCEDLIKEHGGRIEVKSATGQGAEFTVVLPVQSAKL